MRSSGPVQPRVEQLGLAGALGELHIVAQHFPDQLRIRGKIAGTAGDDVLQERAQISIG
ncbi:MAG TPA: hypothetical protein VK745_12535 [Polyangiaceae bacterium]|nr:hypothetical protein [Polyangiaceae bacterium]